MAYVVSVPNKHFQLYTNDALKAEFDRFYESHFGKQELTFALLYGFPYGIRFEIGMGEVYDETYIKNGVARGRAIFDALFGKTDRVYVVVNSFEDDPNDLADNDISTLRPLVQDVIGECKFVFSSTEDEELTFTRYVIKALVKDIQVDKLLEEIMWSDIDGRNSLRGCVYLINPRNAVIYRLYDDRGLDVIASEKSQLVEVYSRFNSWILDYDRAKIDEVYTCSEVQL